VDSKIDSMTPAICVLTGAQHHDEIYCGSAVHMTRTGTSHSRSDRLQSCHDI
jgi:hypothetical protein